MLTCWERAIAVACKEDGGWNMKKKCLAAVSLRGCYLEFASTRLRDDKDVCLAAVSNNGGALFHVSARLQDDKDVCLAAVSNYCCALQNVSKRLQKDKDVLSAAKFKNDSVKRFIYSLKTQ